MAFLTLVPVERPASVVPKHLSSPTITRTSTPTDNSNANTNGTRAEKPVIRNDHDSATSLAAKAKDAVVTTTSDDPAPGCKFLQLTPGVYESSDSAEVPRQGSDSSLGSIKVGFEVSSASAAEDGRGGQERRGERGRGCSRLVCMQLDIDTGSE
ncbi:uncharacterized protein Z519_01020 [Cladophialophora bantiana CBS 173.52]|uniref:Uncharacterized protein n=1 Tax=Cladophialophora bantiana (strain ATCC 10958 / CBS 173.52 / CDC B-1940 / NIH 8579) TaxID=1442370 RepID=A0A0D2F5F1_CLAB1|nr:uncharacterized protein Z519_01020 [Cladophialophora bantiana CBS 173.52]KIW97436.1 hypothetical protein Z519_01020 [Cladophialophora bantiana CBS 173.52]